MKFELIIEEIHIFPKERFIVEALKRNVKDVNEYFLSNNSTIYSLKNYKELVSILFEAYGMDKFFVIGISKSHIWIHRANINGYPMPERFAIIREVQE